MSNIEERRAGEPEDECAKSSVEAERQGGVGFFWERLVKWGKCREMGKGHLMKRRLGDQSQKLLSSFNCRGGITRLNFFYDYFSFSQENKKEDDKKKRKKE